MLLDDDYEWAPHRWLALRDRQPIGLKVRGRLSSRLLAQELVCEPWQVLVASALLNRTRREQAHPALWRVLWLYPTLEALSHANEWDLRPLIEHCGLGVKRVDGLRRMCADLLKGERKPYGVGGYAWESYLIFVHGERVLDTEPEDHELQAFLVEMNTKPIDLISMARKHSRGVHSTYAVQIDLASCDARRR